MLHDAAKRGDVEIPVFCYEPKLGDPVGACRMCLVEVEGIPKLQTSCSTPVRDGMVVHTRTDQVKEAQSAVVEFLLVNHPLDCPVCDKGGECPLQDITMGWGPGKSRFTDEKRHFPKPAELSPLVAIVTGFTAVTGVAGAALVFTGAGTVPGDDAVRSAPDPGRPNPVGGMG